MANEIKKINVGFYLTPTQKSAATLAKSLSPQNHAHAGQCSFEK